MAGLDEDLSEPIRIRIRVPEVIDTRHGDRRIERIRDSGDRGHARDTAVRVAVDAHLSVRPRLTTHEVPGRACIACLSVRPVLHPEILERTAEARPASVVDREHHIALLGQVLLGRVEAVQVRVGAAAMDLNQRRILSAGIEVGWAVQEALDVEAIPAPERDLFGLDESRPPSGEVSELPHGSTRRRHIVDLRAARGRRADEDEAGRVSVRMVAAEMPLHARYPGGDTAISRDAPELHPGSLEVGEEELRPVCAPKRPEVVQPVGRVDLHVDDRLGACLGIEDV